MSVDIVDGSTIVNFVEDEEAFNRWVNDRFNRLDSNQDGTLSYMEMVKELESLRVSEMEPEELAVIFKEFDRNSDGSVDLEEFTEGMRRLMLAIADGIGFLPVQMVLEHDSFLKKAVEREAARRS